MSENTNLVKAETTAIVSPSNYITSVLEQLKTDFQEANAGLDMDFVNMGSWLVLDKKGRFVERDTENIYGDSIDVVIAQGEKRWSLWGDQDSPEDGQLIVAEREEAKARKALADWLEVNPQAAERYTQESLDLRYMAYIVPVSSLGPDSEFPVIHCISFSPTATIQFGRWAMEVFQGKAKALGVPARTGINKIVTRIGTEDMKSRKNASISWLGLTFTAVGMFNPEEYGIKG